MMPRFPSQLELAGRIDRLIEAWEVYAEHGQGRLDEFKANSQPPEVPDRFDSIADMMGYLARKMDYERRLSDVETNRQRLEDQFNQAARSVTAVLPPGIPLEHTNSNERSAYRGMRYEIVHDDSEDPPTVRVRRLDR